MLSRTCVRIPFIMRDDGDKYAMMTERQSEEGKCKVANMQTGLGTNYIIKAMKSESLHRATGRFTLPRNRECNSSEAVTSYPLELTLGFPRESLLLSLNGGM